MAEERADLSTRGLHIKQALVEHGANDSAGAAVLDKGVEFHNYEMADVDVLDAAAQQDALTVDDSIATVKFAENLHRNRPPRM
ncbi:hypothetical protein [Thermocrispum municipale]|uniref:hypothetical protein n=1 Tax=Thermocrispum municipale TaxID=37926 RepID=UPI00040EF9FE|nr:hypothetical protein [Thermocrispum municipale]